MIYIKHGKRFDPALNLLQIHVSVKVRQNIMSFYYFILNAKRKTVRILLHVIQHSEVLCRGIC